MNGSPRDVLDWTLRASELAALGVCVVGVAPAAIHVSMALGAADKSLLVGAQDCAAVSNGARTGEISAEMLAEARCRFVLVGHSERRQYWQETDALVARKFQRAQAAGVTPVLCIGETRDERERGVTEEVLRRQVAAVIELCGIEAFAAAAIAYEPVWAIGTGLTATPEQAQAVHAFIRGELFKDAAMLAGSLRILYGGSVKGNNAAELFAQADIDGGLIGGASLVPDEFATICRAASR